MEPRPRGARKDVAAKPDQALSRPAVLTDACRRWLKAPRTPDLDACRRPRVLARGRPGSLVHQGRRVRRGGPRQVPSDLQAAVAGKLGAWEATPEGALALVVVLDQFPRNMFRGDAKCFAADPLRPRGRQSRAQARLRSGRGGERACVLLPAVHALRGSGRPEALRRTLSRGGRRRRAEIRARARRHHPPLRPLPASQSRCSAARPRPRSRHSSTAAGSRARSIFRRSGHRFTAENATNAKNKRIRAWSDSEGTERSSPDSRLSAASGMTLCCGSR